MGNLKLNGQLSFVIETYTRGLRLMVFDSDEVWVCHKVRVKVLKDFLWAEEGHLFKGRLQLDKSGDMISITVKGAVAGVINREVFSNYLKNHVISNEERGEILDD